MKTQALLVLLCASVALASFETGGDFCDDEKNRFDTCKPLAHHNSGESKSHEGSHQVPPPASHEASGSGVVGSGSGSGSLEVNGSGSGSGSSEASGSGISSGSGSGGWEQGDYCFLLEIFLEFSFTLDVELQFVFQEWINETQITIVENAQLTEYEILVEIYYKLQVFLVKYSEIKTKIQFLSIPGWGLFCDLEGLVLDIQSATTTITIEEVITIVGTSCPLFDALDECAQNGTASEQAAIQLLIKDLTVIIKGKFSFSYKLVLIYEKFQFYFEQYPGLEELCYSGSIQGFGVLGSYVDLSAVYWRIDSFTFAVGGSVSNCKLIQALVSWYSNVSSGSVSERSDIKGLSDKCSAYFQNEDDDHLRLVYFTEQLYQMFILENWTVSVIYSLEIEGFGSLYELIYAFVYCENNGVGPGEFTEEPTTVTSTSTKTSTSTSTKTSTATKPTTTASTTKPTSTSTTTTTTTTTTTKPNGNCATVSSCNVFSNNVTLLITAIENDQQNSAHWNASMIATFKGYLGKIWVYSSNSSSNATPANKFNSIKTVLTGFTTNASFKATVYAIFIQTWGTIGQYITCTM